MSTTSPEKTGANGAQEGPPRRPVVRPWIRKSGPGLLGRDVSMSIVYGSRRLPGRPAEHDLRAYIQVSAWDAPLTGFVCDAPMGVAETTAATSRRRMVATRMALPVRLTLMT